jgi:hypothetical protein
MKQLFSAADVFLLVCFLSAGAVVLSPTRASTQLVSGGSGATNKCGSTCTNPHWWYGCLEWEDKYNYVQEIKPE